MSFVKVEIGGSCMGVRARGLGNLRWLEGARASKPMGALGGASRRASGGRVQREVGEDGVGLEKVRVADWTVG